MSVAAREIREEFLSYFESKGHRRVPSASLVPQADPTLMFVNAGMVPFKRTLLGEETRDYRRATSSQKVIRVSGKHNDLENVGPSPRHHTFFEMLGNFSFGDYFKQEAIEFAWELLTQKFGIEPASLAVSVFRDDEEAFEIWKTGIGIPSQKIYRLDEDENFWSMGDTGPCGPCSELHIDYGVNPECKSEICDPTCDCGRWLEIWNLVFMQFNRDESGAMTPLPRPSIDTGGGLERWASVLQGVRSDYDTDLFAPILTRAQELSGVSLQEDPDQDVSLRVIADHARAVTFLIGDGVLPANAGRGYVLRRILRRASRHGVLLGLEEPFLYRVADAVIDEMASAYPELEERRAYIAQRIRRDEERFLETLSRGLSLLEDEVQSLKAKRVDVLPGDTAFRLYDTYGFPLDLTEDIVRGHGMRVDQPGFDQSMHLQRTRARAAWKGSGDASVSDVYDRVASDCSTSFRGYDELELESSVVALLVEGEPVQSAAEGSEVEVVVAETPFYAESGGQVGDRGVITTGTGRVEIEDTQKPSGELIIHRGKVVEGKIEQGASVTLAVAAAERLSTLRNHSGTHLLHAAIRRVIGPQAVQKGSLVGPDRLRFDFTHDAPLTSDEIDEIEDLVNEWIECNEPARVRTLSYREAIDAGAVALFEEKYGDEVRVISFGDFSIELCGGTHARATGDVGLLKIVSESGIAAGVRRIEALSGMGALRHIRGQERTLREAASLLKTSVSDLPARLEKLLDERRSAQREIEALKSARRGDVAGNALESARVVGDTRVLALRVDGSDVQAMRETVDELRNRLGSGVVLLIAETKGKVLLAIGVTKDQLATYKAGDLIRPVAAVVGGGGGGRPDFAQAGGTDVAQIAAAIEHFNELIDAS